MLASGSTGPKGLDLAFAQEVVVGIRQVDHVVVTRLALVSDRSTPHSLANPLLVCGSI
jgi:hypothetical protein